MLNPTYLLGRFCMSKAWIAGLLLIALTIGFGTNGFLDTKWENGSDLTLSDALYKAASLLAIQTGSLPASGNWQLDLARWLGMLFFASALLAFAIRLSQESIHRLLVKSLARDHVVLAGLGQHGGRLVEALRSRRRSVVVIESNRAHPAIDHCRRLGAIVLFGEPDDANVLWAAGVSKAAVLLALFPEERDCVRIVTAAEEVLRAAKPAPEKPPVRCVLRLIEPGLLDVIRRHKIKTDSTDRFQLEVLNSHEIAATTMVREAAANCRRGSIRKVMVLGLGSHHRLGEMAILRLAKDRLIDHDGRVEEKLDVHVFDKQAKDWLDNFRSRYPFVDLVCTIATHPCWARKVGAAGLESDYDAAFVCIPDEGHATAQAVMLRRDLLTDVQPIMVRVLHSRSGYGKLIGEKGSGWGENLHAIGLEDSLVDPDTATRPETELHARTIHHEFRARQRRSEQSANQPWIDLDEKYREDNRKLAEKYDEYLGLVRYRREFAPSHFTSGKSPLLTEMTVAEVDALAEVEYTRWLRAKQADGWTYAAVRNDAEKKSPFIREFRELTDDEKRYNREFVRGIPRILALADYSIVAPSEVSLPDEVRHAR